MNQATYSEFKFASQLRTRDSAEEPQRAGVREVIASLSLHRGMIVFIAGLGLVAGLGFGLIRPSVYSATAEIILAPADEAAAGQGGGPRPGASIVDSEIQVVRSISVVTDMVRKVGVTQAVRWTERPLPPVIAGVIGPKPLAAPDMDAVVRDIRAGLNVSRKDQTSVIMLTASAANAPDAASLANALASAYIASRSDARSDAARGASAWLRDRLAALKADADAKLAEVEVYRAETQAKAASDPSAAQGAPSPSARDALKLSDLQRQADAAMDVYNQYLVQSKDTGAAGSRGAGAAARIVSPALSPEHPSSAPMWLWPLVGAAAGCVLGAALAAVRVALNNRLVRPDDIRRKIGKTALVSIPLVAASELRQFSPDERSPASLVVAKPMSRLAERMRMLLSQVLSLSIDGHGVVVAVTSAIAEEGKTTTAVGLGRVAAMGGLRVLMIEGDLRMRSLSELAGEGSGAPDMIAALGGEIDWRSALFLDPATQAHIMPAMAPGSLLSNPFASPRMRKILEEARVGYQLIILDCPPVLAIADARSLCAVADGTLMISSWNATPAPAVRTAVRAIEGAGGNIIGVILNRIQPSLASRLSYGDALYDGAASARYFAG